MSIKLKVPLLQELQRSKVRLNPGDSFLLKIQQDLSFSSFLSSRASFSDEHIVPGLHSECGSVYTSPAELAFVRAVMWDRCSFP